MAELENQVENQVKKARPNVTGLPSPSSSEDHNASTPEESTPKESTVEEIPLTSTDSGGSMTAWDLQPDPTLSDIMQDPIFSGFGSMNNLGSFSIDPSYFQTASGFDFASNGGFIPTVNDSFADINVDIPALKVLQSAWKIAEILGIGDHLFDPSFRHTLKPITHVPVPDWLQPTNYQQRVPHHPLIDLFPWPSFRNKLIIMFAAPLGIRPPSARDPMAIMALMDDMDHEVEGLRVSGSGEALHGDAWEVGQVFLNNWHWACDPAIIRNSNRLRESRGAPRLLVPGSTEQT
jgi:hypothetical protein